LALALAGGAFVVTGMFLTGSLQGRIEIANASFTNCGQGLRVGGDVKLRGVLVGRIQKIERVDGGHCRISLGLFPSDTDQIPANVGAQIRAKTVFGEKWVELLYPDDPLLKTPESPSEARIAGGDTIPSSRTIDPLEVETILNVALPLLEAIDPDRLSGALTALAEGFVGHEDAAIRGIEKGIVALDAVNRNEDELEEGIRQLRETGEVFEEIDTPLLQALDNLDDLNRFTADEAALVAETLDKTPVLLRELSFLFETRFVDLVKMVDRGATVVGVLAARADDLDRLLNVLPKFNSSWIRNLNHVCRYRQATDESGKSVGDRVPGRCWRVHNLISDSQGAYGEGGQREQAPTAADYRAAGLDDVTELGKVLFAPTVRWDGGPL
jgi:phospholipid/cholesterol/gamma-HCH transport system substrate-binding protein